MNFTFNDHTLRHIVLDGEPWFIAADVCRCLGLKAHPSNDGFTGHLVRLAKDERRVAVVEDAPTTFSGGCPGKRRQTLVSESALYKLILRAHTSNPKAKEFQDWVTKEVLPAIRKTGGYCLNEEARATAHADTRSSMPLPEEFMAAFEELRREVCSVRAEVFDARQLLEKLVSGESPEPVWDANSGPIPVCEMDDEHLFAAIRSCEKLGWQGRPVYDAMLRERRKRRDTADAAKREAQNAKKRAEAERIVEEARKKAEALLAQIK